MRVVEDISSYSPGRGLCLTIGNFDGLHLGHQALIRAAAEIAGEKGLDFAVMTFWPHPRTVLKPESPHFPLASRDERLRLMEGFGVPLVFELPFDKNVAALSAREFAERTLMPISLSHLVIGHDFSMGRDRQGAPDALKAIGASCGFAVDQIPAFEIDGEPVSSSRLRQTIARGDMKGARKMLGRNYALSGKIVHGEARGRLMGFPTANLGQTRSLTPGHGVYACLAHVNGKTLPAATSVGVNPTFDGRFATVESFFLEGGEDLYDQDMRLEFVEKIRDQIKFPSSGELARQIGLDTEKAREILARREKI